MECLLFQPLYILNTYDDVIHLKVNRFQDGFTRLMWLRVSDNKEFYADLTQSDCEIAGFSEGLYRLCTINTKTQVVSNLMSVYVKQQPAKQMINKLWEYAEVESNDYNNQIKSLLMSTMINNPKHGLLRALFTLYDLIEDKQEFENELFYKLILIQEKLENQYLGSLNRDTSFVKLKIQAQPLLEITDDVDLIKVYNQNQELIQIYRPTGSSQQLVLPDYGFYNIYVMSGTDVLTVLRHCQLSADYIAEVWSKNQESLESYLNAVEDDYNLSSNSDIFSETEKVHYLEELSFTPRNPVFPRIEVLEGDVSRTVDLSISGVRFAEASDHTFFVSGCDADYLQDTVENEFFLVNGTTDVFRTRFNPIHNMIDTEALLYIVDDQNRIVSRVTRCLFDEDWTTTVTEYHEKIRTLEIQDFMRGLAAQVLDTYNVANNYVKDLAFDCVEDTTVNIDNVLEYLLSKIESAPRNIDQDKLSLEILKYWFSVKDYDSDFFSTGGFTWAPYTYRLTTEESTDGYVLCIMAKENGAEAFERHYIHSKNNEALQVLLNRFGRYVIYAISEKDYRFSGFLYLNHNTRYVKSYLLNFKVR